MDRILHPRHHGSISECGLVCGFIYIFCNFPEETGGKQLGDGKFLCWVVCLSREPQGSWCPWVAVGRNRVAAAETFSASMQRGPPHPSRCFMHLMAQREGDTCSGDTVIPSLAQRRIYLCSGDGCDFVNWFPMASQTSSGGLAPQKCS